MPANEPFIAKGTVEHTSNCEFLLKIYHFPSCWKSLSSTKLTYTPMISTIYALTISDRGQSSLKAHANGRNKCQQLPTLLGVVGQKCCVRLHGPKSLTGFKLYATSANKCQHCCGSMQTDATSHNIVGPNNVGCCWPTFLGPFAWAFNADVSENRLPETKNNFSDCDISQSDDWECPSLSPHVLLPPLPSCLHVTFFLHAF